MSEYFVDRNCAPYSFPRFPGDKPDPNARHRFAEIYRGMKAIGIQYECRHTFRRNFRCWLLRRWRDWQRGVVPAAMHGGLDL